MKKIKKLLASLMLVCLCVMGIPINAKAVGLEATFNPVPDTDDRYPELTGTVNDPNAAVVVYVDGIGENAENLGDGTWVIPSYYYPLYDGTYDVRVEANNYDTEEFYAMDYPGGLTVKDDYTMPPEIECDLLDSSNVTNYVIKAKAESGATVHISINDGFNTPIEKVDFADWNGNLTFEPLDLTSLLGGWISITATAVDQPNEGPLDYTSNTSEESITYVYKDTDSLEGPQLNSADYIGQKNQKNYLMSGSAAPNAKINYYFYGVSGPNISGTIDVDASGNFSGNVDLSNLGDGGVTMYYAAKLNAETSMVMEKALFKSTVGPEIQELTVGTVGEGENFNASLSGVADPNSLIKYTFEISGKSVEGEIQSNENGGFALDGIDLSGLPDGDINLTVSAWDNFENTGEEMSRVVTKQTVTDNKDTEETIDDPADPSGVTVTAISADPETTTPVSGALPVAGPDAIGLSIISLLGLAAGFLIRRMKKA